MTYKHKTTYWSNFNLLRMGGYSLALLFIQVLLVSRLPYPPLRVDLLLPLMCGLAVDWPLLSSLSWACFWGFVLDVLSGKFWGFHLGSYVIVVCLANIAVERFEFHNPFYQMAFAGMCALGQSMALGLYLTFELSSSGVAVSTWVHLALRSMIMMLLSPFLIYPAWSARKSWG